MGYPDGVCIWHCMHRSEAWKKDLGEKFWTHQNIGLASPCLCGVVGEFANIQGKHREYRDRDRDVCGGCFQTSEMNTFEFDRIGTQKCVAEVEGRVIRIEKVKEQRGQSATRVTEVSIEVTQVVGVQ